jgi:peptidoglycan/xylan/chitin deacetylase (PgdA/CDA1 family)
VVSASDLHRPFWWDRVGRIDASHRERYLGDLEGDHDLILAESGALEDVPEDLMPASWEMLRQVRGDDCTFGIHTVTHRNLTTLQAQEVSWEIAHAFERLQEELGAVLKVVAYPYGRTNEAVQAETARLGFVAGLSLGFRLVRRPASQLNIGRIDVPQGIDMVTFVCRASGLQLRDRMAPNSRIE